VEKWMYEILAECPLFRGLNAPEIEELMKETLFRIQQFKKGEIIAHHGEIVVSQAVILKGSVKGEMVDFAGKIIKIEDIESPRLLAPAFLFGQNNRFPVNLVANTDVTILRVPREEMVRLMQKSGVILGNFVNNVSSRAQFLTSKIKFLSFTTIKGKVAQYLLDLAGKTGSQTLELPHSQSQLAELFGVTRPSVGRALSEMNRDRILSTEGRRVVLLDPEKLKTLLR